MPRPQMGSYGNPAGMMAPYGGGYGVPQAVAPAPAASNKAPAANAEAVESASVSISQMRFTSPTVTIKSGGTVTWTNADGMPHTVTANDGSFGSEQLGRGGSFSQTFTKPGTYSYYCALHPNMRGTVVVVA